MARCEATTNATSTIANISARDVRACTLGYASCAYCILEDSKRHYLVVPEMPSPGRHEKQCDCEHKHESNTDQPSD